METLGDKLEPPHHGWDEGHSWVVLLPGGGTSGAFGLWDTAMDYAHEVWPDLPEE